jgi:outer membrane protein TolC
MNFGADLTASRQISIKTTIQKMSLLNNMAQHSLQRIIRAMVFICLASLPAVGDGQIRDSLSFEAFRELVIQNHPLAQRANLNVEKGDNAKRIARGAFDPKLQAGINNKVFDGLTYYDMRNLQLEVATPSPVTIKAGYDQVSGSYYNPELKTPEDGLLTAGISLPILRGLVTDERRTALRQANAFNEYSLLEQENMINQLLLDAYMQYWSWWNAYQKKQVAQSVVDLIIPRLNATRELALQGDLPIIDTLETFTQYQNRLLIFQEASALEVKERMMLSSFLWSKQGDDNVAIIITNKIVPTQYQLVKPFDSYETSFLNLRDSVEFKNPELMQYEWKFETLRAEERWKKERIKPSLNVNYNLLSSNDNPIEAGIISNNTYKWGFTFGMPLFLRKEIGELKMTQIKIKETDFEYQVKRQDYKNKATALYENILIFRSQLSLAQNNRNNYSQLLEAEKEEFLVGESSVFLVNQREQQFAEAMNKVIDLQTKIFLLEAELNYVLGTI